MNALIYYITYPTLFVISRLPFNLIYLLSDVLYFIMYKVIRYRKSLVCSNLKLAFPKMKEEEYIEIEKMFYQHLCDVFLEIIKSMGMSKNQMLKRFKIKNLDVLTQFEKENRSAFIMCGHYASWEWMMSLGYHMKHLGFGIYRPIKNPYFNRLIKEIRSKHDAYMIPQKSASDIIRKKEENNELGVYGFASDQSPRPTSKSYWRTFMGIEVPVFNGAERLARELNIPVVFGRIKRFKRGYYELEFKLISDQSKDTSENQITDLFTGWLEEQIKEDPYQYLWTHKRFKHARFKKKL